jgi:hypothetical protein
MSTTRPSSAPSALADLTFGIEVDRVQEVIRSQPLTGCRWPTPVVQG